ncbi:hypothetical protein GQ57_17850 [Burkholderia sp. MSh2]|uniref:Lipoprotein n=1 Tax=Burkholderia paludis TaxID=1506587 RepID=A0A6P2PV72_9BURK|nr:MULTISPECIES: carboxypeptidase-like regulatory domain-containing protein [Burkholderia]KEZ04489.1 hypothetical protein GQ57_17850 [Burkholderia sp. MSh2]CAB3764638.1 hypothetical protein LMG30113_04762 [Burkholderia paludis]VWC09832.1 hypothetical protein BPA30113_05167 [Burkholderia paludis]
MKQQTLAGLLAGTTLLGALAGCGGGDSGTPSSSNGDNGNVTTTLSGTVATGAPLGNVTVTAYDASGSQCGSAVSAADGTYVMRNIHCSSPFLIEAQTADGLLVSPYVGSGIAANMNVTPLTTGIFFGTIAASGVTKTLTDSLQTLDAAQLKGYYANITADLNTMFPPSAYGVDWSSIDPVATPFQANHQLVDAVLDNLGLIRPTAANPSVTYVNTRTSQTFSTTPSGSGGAASVGSVGAQAPLASSVAAANTTVGYLDFNYQQPLASTTNLSGSILDSGSSGGGIAGTVSFGSPQVSSAFTSVGGNYTWGAKIAAASGFDASATDFNLPAVAMLCQSLPGQGTGPSNLKSTDVLVPANAVPVTQASDLIGVSFTRYYEDCLQGGTSPATTTGNYLSFDGQGGATFVVANGGSASQTVTVPAAQVTGALTGTPLVSLGGQPGSTVLSAYRYQTAYGLTRYVLVERGGAGASSAYVGIWLQ